MKIRRADQRGFADHGWLKSYHTFSFADYYDPAHMHFRALRVINEDRVLPKKGFGTHPHSDMEIISYVLEGALQHKDSMGNGSVIRPGDVQRMSAGTGVLHSEFNASEQDLVHFLQIWIVPDRKGHKPSYEQKHFSEADRKNQLRLVASSDGREGSISVHQDMRLFAGVFEAGAQTSFELLPSRHAWVHVARGAIELNETALSAGDAAAFDDAGSIQIKSSGASEILVFDLA